ncbi:alpha/beta hydrolase [Rhodocytophaga rosea]|uniref:Alpha/beta hydrolase n=1 Tax=Rhodocytophaga rosea TaxID=2704465 RepID=A0A6C0GS44_9BACT|nr:alpha/beta fold hydrolase [Rhodocytophaga rosea]QHT70362.1 alpha/beta hydrolase [Rhodocytophaga rosea]
MTISAPFVRFFRWTAGLSIRNKIRFVWFTLVSIFMGWLVVSYQVRGVDAAIMSSDQQVVVSNTEESITFSPAQHIRPLTFIFYPGALVSAKSYAPFARAIALQGYTTIIVKMPFRLASFGHEKALQFIKENKIPQQWVVGGHSLGAAKAAQFAFEHPQLLQGLILIGTSHPRELNLSGLSLDVTKIYGSLDGVASVEEVMAYKKNLPSHSQFIEIEGGNHAQFGYYGSQLGDHSATISRERQHDLSIKATLQSLQRIEKAGAQKISGND